MATGHAGWAESGRDLACAAVSVILQTAWIGWSDVARVQPTGTRRRGRVALSWPQKSRSSPRVRAIVETAAQSIEYLAVQYPRNIKVVTEAADG